MARRTRSLSPVPLLCFLVAVGAVLIVPPLLPTSPRLLFGFSATAMYLLLVWGGILTALIWLLPRTREDQE